MARPFIVEPSILALPIPFPEAEALRTALIGGKRSRELVARLWLTEGFPSAFRECPAIYEDLRGWLGSRLGIHPKEITLIGSARIGYSLAPPPEFGRPFGEHSDLDLSAISAHLFERLVAAFNMFADDYRARVIIPRSDSERAFWDANVEFGGRNIPRGFLDASKIPNFGRYPIAQQVNQTMWALLRKLEATAGTPRVRRASTRVFRDWQCFIDQASLNLLAALPAG